MSKQGLSPKLIQTEYSNIIADETKTMLQHIANNTKQLAKAVRW